jgi:hypothetical protein
VWYAPMNTSPSILNVSRGNVRFASLLLSRAMQLLKNVDRCQLCKYYCSAISIPERATRRWYVECHEPTDTDGLSCLLQLHNVLQHNKEMVG